MSRPEIEDLHEKLGQPVYSYYVTLVRENKKSINLFVKALFYGCLTSFSIHSWILKTLRYFLFV